MNARGHKGLGFKMDKVHQFGVNFKVRVVVDNELIRPYKKISGKVVIETRFPIKHKGIRIQFEAQCKLSYASKFENRTTFHSHKENILQNSKIEIFGYQESPILFAIASDPPAPSAQFISGCHLINPGTVTFPFQLDIPGNQTLPAPFKNQLGSLVYRVAVYMKTFRHLDIQVEVAEHILEFNGHHNLLENVDALTPITLEQFYKKSMFSRKRLVEAVFSVESSGFLPEESIPFVLYVKNPKSIPLHMSVQLIQQVKYDASGRRDSPKKRFIIVDSKEKDCYEPNSDNTWIESLRLRDNQEPSYSHHHMYSLTYILQFIVKISNYGTIKGECPIIVGTTRHPATVLMNADMTLGVPFHGSTRGGSASSANSATSQVSAKSTYSLPPSYSQLSSRFTSMETLPPPYDEVFIFEDEAQHLMLEVPQLTTRDYDDSSSEEQENDIIEATVNN